MTCLDRPCDDGTVEPLCRVCAPEPECTCPDQDDCRSFVDEDGDGVPVAVLGALAFRKGSFHACEPVLEEDCDDGDPQRYVRGWRDEDGDGHHRESLCSFPGEPHIRFEVAGSLDCDDEDPLAYYRGYVDRDGDGVTAEQICGGPDDGLLGATGDDCDDADANVASWQYVDADGDGFGDPTSASCGPPGADLVRGGQDCDDTDPGRPTLIEYWGDGYDGDCDGNDGTDRGNCTPEIIGSSVQICSGTNLALVELCDSFCSNARTLSIENGGTEPFDGSISVRSSTGVHLERDLQLAPGEAGLPFTLFEVGYEHKLSLHSNPEEDCDLRWRDVPAGSCEVP